MESLKTIACIMLTSVAVVVVLSLAFTFGSLLTSVMQTL